MSYSLDLNDTQVFTVLRAFLQAVVGTTPEIIRVPNNRTPMPKTLPFLTMTPVLREQLEWPTTAISNPSVQPQTQSTTMPTMYKIQVDAYGPTASDLVQAVHAVMQSADAFDFFNSQTIQGVYPLYSEDPHQMPLVDGEDQYETRWSMTLCLQYNPSVAATIQTASTVSVGVISVEATYP